MANAINWFEIPAADFKRATKFYSAILGVEMHTTNMGGYDMAFFPSDQTSVSGAVVAGEGYQPGTDGALVYLNAGDDLNHILGKIEAAGGKVLMPKTQITPEYGNFALFLDSEGNKMALHSMN